MRVVIQSALHSTVAVDGRIIGAIDKGMVILVGVTHEDELDDVAYLVNKISKLRIFEDAEGKTNLSLSDIQGAILSISQFTLYANTKKGNRPSFIRAATPDKANQLYEALNQGLRDLGFKVETGAFGAHMEVAMINNGPMTILLDSHNRE